MYKVALVASAFPEGSTFCFTHRFLLLHHFIQFLGDSLHFLASEHLFQQLLCRVTG